MKIKIIFFYMVLFTGTLIAQTKYYTRSGSIDFEASVPSFEEVKATCYTVTSVLNATKGEIAALVLVKGFRFKVALMEEHFNENFAETIDFPKATFTGIIKEFSLDKLSKEPMLFELNGKLTFHGKTVEINPTVSISGKKDSILLTSNFIVKSEDFDIKIPKLIRKKVAETVKVTVNFNLVPKS